MSEVTPKLSMVIPTYTITQELENIAIWACESYREQVDEMIITEDGGMFSPGLCRLADIYIRSKNNLGFTKNVNRGWMNSNGDFTAIVNSDTFLNKGKLYDLCIPGKATSPHVKNMGMDFLCGSFFVVPREIKESRGMLLEELKTYCSDSEYDARVRDVYQKVPSVVIYHHAAKTVEAMKGLQNFDDEQELAKDRETYAKLIKEGRASG